MRRKQLIVNADDYNTDSERNRGILEAARQGIVTSVSVLTNLPGDETARQELRETFKNNIGVHLNLTNGLPLSRDNATLTDAAGRFFSKPGAWARALLGTYALREVASEFEAQINRLVRDGIVPDHIDGNNHIHVFPGIAGVTAGLARRFGIHCIRLPREPLPGPAQLFRAGGIKKMLFLFLCRSARNRFLQAGLRFTDRVAGIQHPAAGDVAALRSFLQTLPGGTTELMCHPGYAARNENPFSTDRRRQELGALTHPEVLQDIKKYGIILSSYADLGGSSRS
ncbi:carbohydrate deacetylase [Thermodesulfobacteriota bacterium]